MMSTMRNKRAYSAPFKFGVTTKRRRTTLAKPSYIKGYYRRAGYYGRYPPLGQELKFKDTTFSQTSVATTGNILKSSVNEVAAGTGESGRIGRKITIRSIFIRYECAKENTTSVTATDDGVRFIVYLDRQCNGATAAVDGVLESTTYLAFNNLANKGRFKVLADKFVDISCMAGAYNGTTSTFGQVGKTKSLYMRCNIPIEFSSTTGAITEIASNNIGLLAITSRGAMNINGNVRIRFSDS